MSDTRDLGIVLLWVSLFLLGLTMAAYGFRSHKHECSLALVTAIDDAVQMLSAEGHDRLATNLATTAEAECKEPR